MITGFFDSKNNLEKTIEFANNFNLQTICLRKYNEKPILNISPKEATDVINILNKAKINISLIDANIFLDFYNENLEKAALENFTKLIKLANKLKINLLVLEVGEVIEIIKEFENIKIILNPFISLAKANQKKIVLKFYEKQNSAEIAYFFNNIKDNTLKVLFYPKMILRNEEAPLTVYRLLKNYIGAFIAEDEKNDQTPELLGYGDTDMVNLFKRLKRDKYSYPVIADHSFVESDIIYKETKTSFLTKHFKKNKHKLAHIELLKKRLLSDGINKDLTLDLILENQIKVLNIIFR